MTVKDLKEQIELALQRGNITDQSKILVYNNNFEVSTEATDTDDFELDEKSKYCFSINFNERY